MFKTIAVVLMLSAGAGYGLLANVSRSNEVANEGASPASLSQKASLSCCATPCPACTAGCELCCDDCNVCCSANPAAVQTVNQHACCEAKVLKSAPCCAESCAACGEDCSECPLDCAACCGSVSK
jgi:hypothetical protein